MTSSHLSVLTLSACALILVGILPTDISQVIVGGNFLSYLNRKSCNKQKTQSRRSLWSANYLSKSRKIEVEIFHIRLIKMEIFELLNQRFLFQVSEILVCVWTLAALNWVLREWKQELTPTHEIEWYSIQQWEIRNIFSNLSFSDQFTFFFQSIPLKTRI